MENQNYSVDILDGTWNNWLYLLSLRATLAIWKMRAQMESWRPLMFITTIPKQVMMKVQRAETKSLTKSLNRATGTPFQCQEQSPHMREHPQWIRGGSCLAKMKM